MNVQAIRARRETIRHEMKAIHDAHPDILPGEAHTRFAALEAESAGLAQAERRAATIDEIDRITAGQTVSGTGDSRLDALQSQVRAQDVIAAQMGATTAGAGRAREASDEIARRSGRSPQGMFWNMGASNEQRNFTTNNVGGTGSALIQTTVSPNVIDRLREKVMVRRMGATVLGGLTGNLAIPRLKTSASAQWVGEGTQITESDPATEQVTFSPKHCGALVEMSRNMLMQSSADVATLIENDLAALLAVALDQAAVMGGGTNQPSGILAAGSGITIVPGGTNGAAITWANVVNLIGAVDASNALDGSLAFLTNAKVVKSARQTVKTATDTSSNFIMNNPAMLAGYTLGSTQNVPSNLTKGTGTNLSALIFGDFSQLFLAFWSELNILVNPYAAGAYAAGNVQIRAMLTADIRLRQPLAFAALTDVVA